MDPPNTQTQGREWGKHILTCFSALPSANQPCLKSFGRSELPLEENYLRMLHVPFFDIQAHKGKSFFWMDINITVWRERQREHREASRGSWPKLTRDIMHMRKKREEKRDKTGSKLHERESVSLTSAALSFHSSLLLTRRQNSQFSNQSSLLCD